MWKLVIEDDEGKRTVVPLTRDDYSIGRKEGNTIRLTERNVSRQHARLRRKGDEVNGANAFMLEDESSYNGVYVNGLRVAQGQELVHGDLIQIGDYRILLHDDTVVDAPTTGASLELKPSTAGTNRGSMLLERPNRLVMLAGPTPGAEFPLDHERMTIGRAEDAGISVNHNSVSRLHCEVHSLGEGRFEIVDKGSSNGVRVNSAELRRGIIEAGDVIELGDVKFKFVGAGQIFLPGVNDSQQLSAITDRTVQSLAGPRSGLSVLPYVILGALAAVVSVGAWMYFRKPPPVVVTAPPTPVAFQAEHNLIAEAKRLCATGDCDGPFEKVLNEIPQGSPVRDGEDFKQVAYQWGDSVLARAAQEPDLDKKRALLHRVEQTQVLDGERRRKAADLLQELETAGTSPIQLPSANRAPLVVTTPTALPVANVDAGDSGARKPPPPPQVEAPPSLPVEALSAAPKNGPRPAPPTGDVADRARTLMLQGAAGETAARQLLEPRVLGNRASADEVRLLKAICKDQGDKTCLENLKKL